MNITSYNKSIAIVFPPFSEYAVNGPAFAPVFLQSLLHESNVSSNVIDANIELARIFLSPLGIGQMLKYLKTIDTFHARIDEQRLQRYLQYSGEQNYDTGNIPKVLTIFGKYWFLNPEGFQELLSGNFQRVPFITDFYLSLVKKITSNNQVCFISCPFSNQLPEAILIAKYLKQTNPSVKIVIGGSQVNLMSAQMLQLLVDSNIFGIVFKGHAESGLVEIINEINNDTKQCRLIENNNADIKKYDNQNLKFENLALYYKPVTLPVVISLGCFWGKCTFCDYARLLKNGCKTFYQRPAHKVFNELQHISGTFNYDQIRLVSDAIPPAFYSKLSELAVQNNFNLQSRGYMMHHAMLTREYFNQLKKSGVKIITFGTESLCNRILKLMNKPFDCDLALQNITDAHNAGIYTIVNIIPDFPGITVEEANEMHRLLSQNAQFIDMLNIQSFDLTQGTPVAENPDLFGLEIVNSQQLSHHGYHAMAYRRKTGINETEKEKILNEYFLLSVKIAKLRKKRLLLKHEIKESTRLLFYFENFTVKTDGNNGLWVENIKAIININENIAELISLIESKYSNSLSLEELKKCITQVFTDNSTKTFLTTFQWLLSNGLINRVINTGS